jgi:hypothetical protein
MTSSVAATDSCHVHFSLPLVVADQVQGVRYSESEVETDTTDPKLETDVASHEMEMDAAAPELETDAAVLDLEMETDVSQELSKQERYSAD